MRQGCLAVLFLLFLVLTSSLVQADLIDTLQALDEEIVADQEQVVENYAFDSVQVMYATNFKMIATNPEINADFFGWVFSLVAALYVLVFAYLGLQFMMSGSSLTKRTELKGDIQKAIIFAILLVASGFIFTTALEVENYLVELVAKPADFTIDNPLMDSGVADLRAALTEYPTLSFFYALALAFSGATLAARHLIVLVGGMIFPFLLFMFFTPFDITKKIGDLLLKLLAVTIFIPFMDSLVVLATSDLVANLATDTGMRIAMLAFGFILIGGLNLLITAAIVFTPKASFIAVTQMVGKARAGMGG